MDQSPEPLNLNCFMNFSVLCLVFINNEQTFKAKYVSLTPHTETKPCIIMFVPWIIPCVANVETSENASFPNSITTG